MITNCRVTESLIHIQNLDSGNSRCALLTSQQQQWRYVTHCTLFIDINHISTITTEWICNLSHKINQRLSLSWISRAHRVALISISAWHQPKPQYHGYGASASNDMPVYFPAFTSTLTDPGGMACWYTAAAGEIWTHATTLWLQVWHSKCTFTTI